MDQNCVTVHPEESNDCVKNPFNVVNNTNEQTSVYDHLSINEKSISNTCEYCKKIFNLKFINYNYILTII